MTTQRIIQGDCIEGLRTLPDASVHCCVTSPPYWGLRDYGHDGQIGLEATPEAYVARMVEVFREVRRVLRDDGTCWVNLGDSYCGGGGYAPDAPCNQRRADGESWGAMNAFSVREGEARKKARPGYTPPGLKAKDLCGIPWRVAFALQADGWWLRQDIIWHKPNPMPESVRDRCTKAHEYVFLLTKSQRYYYDAEATSESLSGKPHAPGNKCSADGGHLRNDFGTDAMQRVWGASGRRNRRSVWTVTTKPYSGAHFAVMPPDLVEPCIKAGCPEQCCPVCGAGYERITAKQKRFESGSGRSGNAIEGKQDLAASDTNSTPDIRMGPVVSVQTLGWAPACDCAASGTMPGTVLDPFAGSGTTLAVAAELGRNGIGCELNPEYIALAERRIKDARASVALFEGVPA
jgi:site-specific DNA-methyltransferase (adenine-specific)